MLTKTMQRALIAGWVFLAFYLMSSFANAQDMPTIITQQGAFTIIETATSTHVCTRQGVFIVCN